MIEYIKLKDIQPAAYNPREISDAQFEMLKHSVKELGYIIPILVNRKNNVIIAGHQRTKAGLAIGIEDAPVFFVDEITSADEIKFNQIHNGVDIKEKDYSKILKHIEETGFTTLNPKDVQLSRVQNAQYVKEMCKLILKYGNVLCAVACDDQILLHTNYIRACKALNIDANIYNLPLDKKDIAIKFFSEDYGHYSYKHLKKETYVQGLAQMYRLSSDKSKKQNKSALYENVALPFIFNHDINSVLDFGCGKAAYINMLKAKKDAIGIEFYNHNMQGINVSMGNAMIDKLIKRVEEKGAFDMVVCDSVLNSVDSKEAEDAVMGCLSLFSNGYIAFSGRTFQFVEKVENQKTATDTQGYVHFFDADKFTANYRKGQWFYQHFHDKKDILALCDRFELEIISLDISSSKPSWQCLARKKKSLDKEIYKKAIEFEFNLPLPGEKRYNRHLDMLKALKNAGLL